MRAEWAKCGTVQCGLSMDACKVHRGTTTRTFGISINSMWTPEIC